MPLGRCCFSLTNSFIDRLNHLPTSPSGLLYLTPMNTLRYGTVGRFIKLLTACLSLAVGFYAAGTSSVFAALRELPLISIDVDNGVMTSSVHTGLGAVAPASATGTAKAPKAGKNTVQDAQSQLVYTISIRNLSSFPANNLTLEYHFYNKTTANDAGVTTISVADVTSTESLSLPVNSKRDIQTIPISHEVKQTYAQSTSGGTNTAGTKKKGGSSTVSSGQTDVTTTRVMGYVIIVKSGGTIIKTLLSDDDIVDQVRAIQARMAAAQGP